MSAIPQAMNTERQSNGLREIARAILPTSFADVPLEMRAFRDDATGLEHLALVKHGAGTAALVRIHSECLTGEAFGSLRCDCGPQLQEAIRQVAASERGAIIYLRGHEGRGIGLANKIRAYELQDKGMDTVEANVALGFKPEQRTFEAAAAILESLEMTEIVLLSNNPDKTVALQSFGISVTSMQPLAIVPNPHNLRYLEVKRDKFGHQLTLEQEQP